MRFRRVLLSSLSIPALVLVPPLEALAYEDLTPAGGEVSFHLGVFEPRGESELWRENRRLLTQDVSDFDDLIHSASFASHLNPYLDFVIGAKYYESSVDTKYRDFFFDGGDPIEQSERLRMIPIDLSVRFLPTTRTAARGSQGRRLLRPVVPYLGFGGGALLWDYREEGNFIDFSDPNDPVVFNANSHARGITGSYHVLAGV